MTNDGGIIRWENPPDREPAPQTRPWALVALQLRQNPGRWAPIDDESNGGWLQPRINGGYVVWWKPKGGFEATAVKVDGRIYTYARYMGP